VGDGNILESDVELLGTLEKVGADAVADGFTLGDELGGVELSNDRFQDLVSDGWKNTFIIVLTKALASALDMKKTPSIGLLSYLVDLWKLGDLGSMQHSQCQANHLQILASGCRRNVSWLCSDIVDNALLQPWDQEMGSFADDLFLYSGNPIEDDGTRATLHVVNRGLN
jgi:hypothetical protein